MADERNSVTLSDLRIWLVFGALVVVAIALYVWFAPSTPPVMVPGGPEGVP